MKVKTLIKKLEQMKAELILLAMIHSIGILPRQNGPTKALFLMVATLIITNICIKVQV